MIVDLSRIATASARPAAPLLVAGTVRRTPLWSEDTNILSGD